MHAYWLLHCFGGTSVILRDIFLVKICISRRKFGIDKTTLPHKSEDYRSQSSFLLKSVEFSPTITLDLNVQKSNLETKISNLDSKLTQSLQDNDETLP